MSETSRSIVPVKGDIVVFLGTDAAFQIPVMDQNGDRFVFDEAQEANLQVSTNRDFEAVLLEVACTVVDDPEAAGEKVLQIVIPKAELDPETFPVTRDEKKYPYSIRLTSPTEIEVRYGDFVVRRTRP